MFDGLAAPLAVMRAKFDPRRREALRAPNERDQGERDDAAAQVQAIRELALEHLWVEQLGETPTMRASARALVDRYSIAAYDQVDRIQPTRSYQS